MQFRRDIEETFRTSERVTANLLLRRLGRRRALLCDWSQGSPSIFGFRFSVFGFRFSVFAVGALGAMLVNTAANLRIQFVLLGQCAIHCLSVRMVEAQRPLLSRFCSARLWLIHDY